MLTHKFEIPFSGKIGLRFQEYVSKLASANRSDVYVWTSESLVCGVLMPISLSSVEFLFPFEINMDGIVSFLTADLRDRLVLDWYVSDGGGQMLEIEANGAPWGEIRY